MTDRCTCIGHFGPQPESSPRWVTDPDKPFMRHYTPSYPRWVIDIPDPDCSRHGNEEVSA